MLIQLRLMTFNTDFHLSKKGYFDYNLHCLMRKLLSTICTLWRKLTALAPDGSSYSVGSGAIFFFRQFVSLFTLSLSRWLSITMPLPHFLKQYLFAPFNLLLDLIVFILFWFILFFKMKKEDKLWLEIYFFKWIKNRYEYWFALPMAQVSRSRVRY